MKFEIKTLPEKHANSYMCSLHNESGPLATVFQGPTFNCQLFSIAGFGNLLSSVKDNQEVRKAVETAVYYFDKNNVLLDVLEHDVKRIKEIFNDVEEFLVDTPYENNTGSMMRILIIKTNYIVQENDSDDEWDEDDDY